MALLSAREDSRKQGTTSSTQNEFNRSWRRWGEFLESLQFKDDPYLITISEPWQCKILFSTLAQALRKASFFAAVFTNLSEGTVQATVDHVAQAFRHGQQTDPCLDNEGILSILLLQQYRGYRNLDANIKHQKALPLIVLRQLSKNYSSIENIAMAQLCVGDFLFAMSSCKYLQTNISEEKR